MFGPSGRLLTRSVLAVVALAVGFGLPTVAFAGSSPAKRKTTTTLRITGTVISPTTTIGTTTKSRTTTTKTGTTTLVSTTTKATTTIPSSDGSTVPTFTEVWNHTVQRHINLSDPALVEFGGRDAVVVGDTGSDLDALWLSDGSLVPGWPVQTAASGYSCKGVSKCPYVSLGIASPISADPAQGSTDTDDVFLQVGGGSPRNGDLEPDFEAFDSAGQRLYSTDPAVESKDTQVELHGGGSGPGLSGITLANVDGTLQGFSGGSTGHQLYGFDAYTGLDAWSWVNGDTVTGTPAVGSVGFTEPVLDYQVGDATYSPSYQGSFAGAYLRVMETDGSEVCSAHLINPVGADDNAQGGSWVTSPAVADFGGVPLVVIGQGDRSWKARHLMAFDTACQEIWESPALAGPTNYSPVVADVTGNGVPSVIEETKDDKDHPIIYELSGATGAIIRQRLLPDCTGTSRYTTSQSVVTADLTGDAYQDIIAQAGDCGYVVLDGRTLNVVPTGPHTRYLRPECGGSKLASSNNTPLVTSTSTSDGTVMITIAGTGRGAQGKGCLVSYAVRGRGAGPAALGVSGWPEFHRDPWLSGLEETSLQHFTERDVLGPGETLSAGQELTSANGRYTAAMQTDGNFVVYQGSKALWETGTYAKSGSAAGATVTMETGGALVVDDAAGQPVWSSNTSGGNPTELVMQDDGDLVLYEGPNGNNIANTDSTLWSSGT